MSRKVYKIKELDILSRWGYKYIASVSSNYFASTYYKLRSISDLLACSGVVKDCPSVTTIEDGINWNDTVKARDIGEMVNVLTEMESGIDGLEKV